jgi:hypothetical protein
MRNTLRALWMEAETRCAYCGRETVFPSVLPDTRSDLTATVDHVVPISRGGQARGSNCVLACMTCNNLKADMMPQEWRAFMLSTPGWWWKEPFRLRRNGVLRQPRAQPSTAPASMPWEYEDPRAQAAFEAVYKDRLHMLRFANTVDT